MRRWCVVCASIHALGPAWSTHDVVCTKLWKHETFRMDVKPCMGCSCPGGAVHEGAPLAGFKLPLPDKHTHMHAHTHTCVCNCRWMGDGAAAATASEAQQEPAGQCGAPAEGASRDEL